MGGKMKTHQLYGITRELVVYRGRNRSSFGCLSIEKLDGRFFAYLNAYYTVDQNRQDFHSRKLEISFSEIKTVVRNYLNKNVLSRAA
jgi:hypothetical protein